MTTLIALHGANGTGKHAIIDADMADSIQGYKYYLVRGHNGEMKVARNKHGSLKGSGSTWAYLAKDILGISGSQVIVVHADGDILNCARANLTTKTAKGISAYGGADVKPKVIERKSKYDGVLWDGFRMSWRSQYTKLSGYDGVLITRIVGFFPTQEEARDARVRDAKKLGVSL